MDGVALFTMVGFFSGVWKGDPIVMPIAVPESLRRWAGWTLLTAALLALIPPYGGETRRVFIPRRGGMAACGTIGTAGVLSLGVRDCRISGEYMRIVSGRVKSLTSASACDEIGERSSSFSNAPAPYIEGP